MNKRDTNKIIPVTEFDYHLPQERIGQKPIEPRDHARLLILDRKSDLIEHRIFRDLAGVLGANDVLVLNNSKVIPARLHGQKESGGKVEIFLLKKVKLNHWETLIKGSVRAGQSINLSKTVRGEVLEKRDQINIIKFNCSDRKLFSLGETPTPPYIKQKADLGDYQTIYAKTSGSVAAPTAGLHFTKSLLTRLKKKGVRIEYLTLHVGMGTFAPVKSENILEHKMHSELAVLDSKTARRLNIYKDKGKRIIAVGTTSVRTLEAFTDSRKRIHAGEKWVNIFIYPGYKFKFVDSIITNFHLPKSTLIMLVSAFADAGKIKRAYQEAIKKKYYFYSFGDAMMIK